VYGSLLENETHVIPSSLNRRQPPLVSVIMPTYNGAGFIAESIESALAQDYPRLELIVANDGSTDGTARILDSYADRIRVLALPHRGENRARNAAVAESRGEYIALLDHDDLWLPGKISLQVKLLEEHPRAGLCHTGYQHFDTSGLGMTVVQPDGNPYEGCCFEAQFRQNGVGALTAVVRRSALPRYVFHEDIPIAADYALWLDILLEHEAVYVPRVLALHRRHAKQITHGRTERWKVHEAAARLRLLARIGEQLPDAGLRELREWTLETLRQAAYERRAQRDHGWAALGFALLRRSGQAVPWYHRWSTQSLGRLQWLTPAGRAEARYLRLPA
jgi:glycosyltransferase involved in cell wall biosynthesis